MKVNRTILVTLMAIIMAGMICGCEEQAKVSDEPTVSPQTAEPTPEPVVVIPAVEPNTADSNDTEPNLPPPVIPALDPNAPAPKIVFKTLLADFNDVGPGTRQTVEVEFTNEGKGILNIIRVDGCCGCSGKLTKQTIPPGESGTLKITCSFASRPGAMRRTMYLHSNDPNTPKSSIAIKANIVQKIGIEPATLKLFLNKENAGCEPIKLTSLDGQPFSISSVNVTAGAMTVDFDPTVKATEFVLQPKIVPERLKNGLSGYIEMQVTHPGAQSVAVGFNALPRYKLSPPQVIVFNAEAGKPLQRKIWVLNNYEEPFEIESTTAPNGTIQVLKQSEITNGYQFEVRITPPKQETNKTVFTDTFTVKIRGGETLTVPLRGFYMRRTQ